MKGANLKAETLQPEMGGSGLADAGTTSVARPSRARPLDDGHDEMLTKKELAARLKVTLRTIENWQRAGHLPFIKISSVVLFDWAEVRESLHANFKVCRRGAIRPGKF